MDYDLDNINKFMNDQADDIIKGDCSVGTLIDRLYIMRESRKELEKEVDKMNEKEEELKRILEAELSKLGLQAAKGTLAGVSISFKETPTVFDWDKVYKYILEHDAFEILHKRLSTTAVLERFENADSIEGIKIERFQQLKLTKR